MTEIAGRRRLRRGRMAAGMLARRAELVLEPLEPADRLADHPRRRGEARVGAMFDRQAHACRPWLMAGLGLGDERLQPGACRRREVSRDLVARCERGSRPRRGTIVSSISSPDASNAARTLVAEPDGAAVERVEGAEQIDGGVRVADFPQRRVARTSGGAGMAGVGVAAWIGRRWRASRAEARPRAVEEASLRGASSPPLNRFRTTWRPPAG